MITKCQLAEWVNRYLLYLLMFVFGIDYILRQDWHTAAVWAFFAIMRIVRLEQQVAITRGMMKGMAKSYQANVEYQATANRQ